MEDKKANSFVGLNAERSAHRQQTCERTRSYFNKKQESTESMNQ